MTPSAPALRRVSPIPPQHGAWAFLGLPLAVGFTMSDWTPLLILLAVGWVATYPMSYFILAIVRDRSSRRPDPRRFQGPLMGWAAIAVPSAAALAWFRPWLIWVGLLYLAGFAVSIGFARRRDERALANDAVFIAQCAFMVTVTWAVSAGDSSWAPPPASQAPTGLWTLTVSTALLLTGSMLHVKSLIRERGDPRYRSASRWLAVGSVPASIVLAAMWGLPASALLPLPFAFFAARAIMLRGPAPRPARIGLIELAGFLLLLLAAVAGTST